MEFSFDFQILDDFKLFLFKDIKTKDNTYRNLDRSCQILRQHEHKWVNFFWCKFYWFIVDSWDTYGFKVFGCLILWKPCQYINIFDTYTCEKLLSSCELDYCISFGVVSHLHSYRLLDCQLFFNNRMCMERMWIKISWPYQTDKFIDWVNFRAVPFNELYFSWERKNGIKTFTILYFYKLVNAIFLSSFT